MTSTLKRGLKYFLLMTSFILLLGVAMPNVSFAQDIPVKTQQKKIKKKRIKPKKKKNIDKSKSNKKQLRQTRAKRGRKADKASKGDITGRKYKPDRTPRKTYVRPAENPYAGRKMNAKNAEKAGRTPAPNFRAPPKGEKPRKGDIAGKRRVRTVSGSSARKRTYQQPPVQSRSRSSERSIKSRRGDVVGRSVSRPAERSRSVTTTVPKSVSGGGKIRRKRNPYAGKQQRSGESASNKDIAGRKIRTRGKMSAKPAPKRGYKKPDTYYGRKSKGEGGRFSKGTMAAGGYSSGSRSSEQAAKSRRSDPSTKNYRSPKPYSGKVSANPNVTTQPRREGSRFKQRKTTVRSNSRSSESNTKAQVTVPRSISGGAKISKKKNPYAGRKQRAGERSTNRDISGRKNRTRNYTSPSPKWGKRVANPDPYYARSERSTKVKTSPVPTYVPGRNQIKASNYKGRQKSQARLSGGGGSISGRSWNNKGQPVQRPSNINPRISAYQGRQKSKPQLSGGGGSISGKLWNNKGQPVQRPSNINPRISAYQGRQKSKPQLSGGGGSISGKSWNNKGKPVQSPGYVNPRISRYQGNVKSQRELKGGGSISRSGWNNKGQPLQSPGFVNPRISRYQGNIKATRELKGGGSISRSGWNNKERPISSPGYVNPKISNYQGDRIPNPGYYNTSIGRYKGEMKTNRTKMRKDGKLPQKLPGAQTIKASQYQGDRIPTPGYFNTSIGRYRGDFKVRRSKTGGGSVSGKLWNNNEKPIPVRTAGKDSKAAPEFTGRMNAKDYKKPEQSEGTELGRARSVIFITPGKAKRYRWTKQEKASRSEGTKIGGVKSFSFITPGRAKKYGGITKIEKTGKTDGTKYGRFNTFSFYTPQKVKKYGGVVPTQIKVTKKQMHPSASYTRGDAKSSSEAKDKTFKFGIWWAKIFKKNENQPENLKTKEKKPRYDKRETELWYE